MRRRLALSLLAVAASVSPPGVGALAARTPDPRPLVDDAEPRVTVALSPSELTVGDRVDAVLTVSAPEAELAGPPRFPDWEVRWGSAEVLEVSPPETLEPQGGVAAFRQRLVLTAFRPGEVALPPREVEVPLAGGPVRVATPAELSFEISPVLPPPAEEGRGEGGVDDGATAPGDGDRPELEPRPENPLRTLPLTRAFWVAAGTLGAVCLALALLLWRQTGPPAPRPRELTPLARLERDLETLTGIPSPVEAHALLSRALRHYLGRELGFPAPESTTTEIRRELAARRLPQRIHLDTGEVLAACDLVKFARRETSPGGLRRRIGTVRRVSREMDVALHPPPHATPHRPTPRASGSEEGTP